MKNTIGIILLVIVGLNLISIIVHLSNGDSIGSPIYLIILVMMLIGGIILLNSDNKKKGEITGNTKKIDNRQSDDQKSIVGQRKILDQLKKGKVLTEEEYLKKIKILDDKERTYIEEQLKNRAQEKTHMIIKKLDYLLKTGLLTQYEYNQKKEQIILKKIAQIRNNPCKRVKFDQLTNWQKRSVRDYFIKSNGKNIFLLKGKGKPILSLTKEEFNELKLRKEINNFYYIVLPEGFDPKQIK